MKKVLVLIALILSMTTFSQTYSTYYGTYDVNQNVNVNNNVNVSGTVYQNINKTVTSIDYGALAAANAQNEANRINAMQYTDARHAQRALEIAQDPFAAYKYGSNYGIQAFSKSQSRQYFKESGFSGKIVFFRFTQPSKLLFNSTGLTKFRNTSADGKVLCELEVNFPSHYSYAQEKFGKELYPDADNVARAMADQVMTNEIGGVKPGVDGDIFTHKAELGTATVFGHKGYRATWIYENDFDYVIKDNYYAFNSGILFQCGIIYTVEKSRGTFEDLEGRRFYLRRLCEEVIATAELYFR